MKDKKNKNKKDGGYFVYTGSNYPHKNLPRLIEAIVFLNKNSNNRIFKLKISSGRNVFASRLKKMIDDNKAQEYTELLGYVSDEKISILYKDSLAFVFPTLSEGFGLPPKEAIEAGTIAIVSDIPVLREVYEDSVFYFNPYDVESIARLLEYAIKMPESQRKDKIKKAQKFLKKYSWTKMAKQTLDIYNSFFKNRNI